MPNIKILPPGLVDKIAAGEVVERPASVVKELVENALDANATFIEVAAKSGGKEEIKVRDNGVGMDEQDAKLAIKRYATSKISSEDDLNSIGTFGFRGEALSSIAAVSKLTLKTATEDAVSGVEVFVKGGSDLDVRACAHPRGTTVLVNDLFYNIPARRKFLKTSSTEFKHIRDVFKSQALITPDVGFSLLHNGKQVYIVSERQTWPQRIASLLDWDLDHFFKLDLVSDYLSVRGYLGLPELARKRRPGQYIFVNQRALYNKTVSGAIYSAYEGLLPKGVHAPYIVAIDIREDLVDANVHPRKEEVRFVSPNTVYSTVKNAASSSLSKAAEHRSLDESAYLKPTDRITGFGESSQGVNLSERKRHSKTETEKDWAQAAFGSSSSPKDSIRFYDQLSKSTWDSGIYQMANLYLLVPKEDGLLLYDQHAAEERILYEEFMREYKDERSTGSGQELLFGEQLNLSKEDRHALVEYKDVLESLGFRFEGLDSDEEPVVVVAVPVLLQGKDVKTVLLEFIDDIVGGQPGIDEEYSEPESEESQDERDDMLYLDVTAKVKQALVYLACRSAVKKGDSLSEPEMYSLIERLESLGKRGLTCPHGRPTRIKISLSEFGKMFKRS